MHVDIIKKIIKENYNLDLNLAALVGWADVNYKGESKVDAKMYLIKISDKSISAESLRFQNRLLEYVSEKELDFATPTIIVNNKNEGITEYMDGQLLRVLTWVPGEIIAKVNPQLPAFLYNLGQVVGKISAVLFAYKDAGGNIRHEWDSSNLDWMYNKIKFVDDADILSVVNYFLRLSENNKNGYGQLRKSICHNDLNDYNILTDLSTLDKKITGVIDFGDAVYTHTINELAIALAYVGMDKVDPLQAMCHAIRGYHSVFPLEERELDILYIQIGLRLSISVVHAAENKVKYADNAYLFVSVKPTLNLLKYWEKLNPNIVLYFFRNACGMVPCASVEAFQKYHNKNINHSIITFKESEYTFIDLSITSEDLGSFDDYSTSEKMSRTIRSLLAKEQKQIGIGGYGEIRPFYMTPNYEVKRNNGINYRAQHLGVDIWCEENTNVFAPFDGTVYSIKNNSGDLDYGPTIILEHLIDTSHSFFTLYGHLSESSLSVLSEGDKVDAGEHIGFIGHQFENGGWPAHLHFQIILDMLDYTYDFPGVAIPDTWSVWSSFCPDPTSFFARETRTNNIKPYNLLERRKEILGPNLSLSYQEPLQIVRGQLQYFIGADGRRYLDLVNNVAHVGHEHPEVVKAGQRQMAVLNTNTRYLHDHIIEYGEELLSTFPDPLGVVYFANSGSEANELALRIARTVSGHDNIVALEGAYHGNTAACIDVSSYKFNGPGGRGKPDSTILLPMPNTYSGPFSTGKEYIDQAIDHLNQIEKSGTKLAGLIVESILSCAGQILLPEGYLAEIYDIIRRQHGLCIADEVQVGFGRSGSHFWAFEMQHVIPDIVTLGKPMGNGHPLAAVITTNKIADDFNNGMEYFNTFGGNPVSCAIGRAVLNVIKQEKLQQNAREIGDFLKSELQLLQVEYPLIGDVRGKGLFLGIELVLNRETKIPAPAQAKYVVDRMYENGLLLSTDGPNKNIIKIKPPMCIRREDVNNLIHALRKIFKENYLKIE